MRSLLYNQLKRWLRTEAEPQELFDFLRFATGGTNLPVHPNKIQVCK